MTESQHHRLRDLLLQNSVRSGSVTLASGAVSDWFIDCKQTVLTAEGHHLVAELCIEKLAGFSPRPVAVAGVALGGCPLASAVAQRSFATGNSMDAIYVRKGAKDHGSQRKVEGDDRLPQGAPIAILEDVVTTGRSTIEALECLRDRPFQVVGIWALVDRLEGGAQSIAAQGVPFVSQYTRQDFEP